MIKRITKTTKTATVNVHNVNFFDGTLVIYNKLKRDSAFPSNLLWEAPGYSHFLMSKRKT